MEKQELTSEEYKSVLIDVLTEFDAFCRNHSIRYFLVGGSLLGAIRHKGFIPWDDDIDVGMPQEDYDKFKKLYVNNDSFYFVDCFTNHKYYLPFGKFCSNRVDLHENINSNFHIGAYVDVFPFNFIKQKDSKGLIKALNKKSLTNRLLDIKYASPRNKSFPKKILITFLHILYPVSLNRIAKNKVKKFKKFISEKPTQYFGCLYRRGIEDIGKSDYFYENVEVIFEGRKYFAPIGYDDYLKEVYGDYMEWPPIDQQAPHHSFSAYWK